MRVTLRQLQIFRAVAQTGSTTAASDDVALSQSATSAAINELERVLGARLFDRIGKRLLINDTGRALLPNAQMLLDGAQSIEDGFESDGNRTTLDLRLAASTTIGNYVLPPLLASFRTELPLAHFSLRIGNTQDVANAVTDFEVDLGLIEGPCHASGVTVLPWREDELVIVAAPRHPLAQAAKHNKLTLKQLRQVQWLLREPGSGTREAAEQALIPHLHHLPADMTLGSSEAIKNALVQGVGVSCLSRYVVQDLVAAKRLCILPTKLPRITRRLALIHHSQKHLSRALLSFIAHCRTALQES
ncbi:MAG TPA: LysR family transcriptional regulator [Steroidobacteraceae bacterium]|jgi:DNA-binding transcriptional LysR family regulator